MILTRWGKEGVPTRFNWLHGLWEMVGMEKIIASISHSPPRFDKTWKSTLEFVSTEFNELTCPMYLRVLGLTRDPLRDQSTTLQQIHRMDD